jgi:hypothetical protein
MKTRFAASIAAMLAIGSTATLAADNKFEARLSGYNEVHFAAGPPAALRGAISTKAQGSFKAEIDEGGEIIRYELSYGDLEGAVTQSHIHFGQHHTVGGIVVWLCQTAGTPAPAEVAGLTPSCPASGTVTGTIVPAQVLAQAAQGFALGEFAELVRAIRAGATYANVHSTLHPPGEIRGQISSLPPAATPAAGN